MNIRFLGTSFGAPSKRRCQQSILVETHDIAYLFDAGAPVLDILVNSDYDVSKIKAIFISHLHGDHINGIFDIINLAAYFSMNLTVYLPEKSGIELFETYMMTTQNRRASDRIEFGLIDRADFYDDGILKVKCIPTAHMESENKPSYGFLLEDDHSRIFITGDLNRTLKDFPEFLYSEHTDMIVTEAAHPSAELLFEKLDQCKTDMTAVVHVMPVEKYDNLKKCAEISRIQVIFPNDNDEIRI